MPPRETETNRERREIAWQSRVLNSDDQDFLWDLFYIALWDPPGKPRRPRSVLKKPHIRLYVENWGRPDDLGLAAVHPESGSSVGAIWTRLDHYGDPENFGCDFPCIGIAVLPEYQAQGVGNFLMEALIEAARQRVNVSGLRLGIHPENHGAIRLYRKFGFTEYAVGPGEYPQMKLEFRN